MGPKRREALEEVRGARQEVGTRRRGGLPAPDELDLSLDQGLGSGESPSEPPGLLGL